ncbi:MAG: porin family protein [Gammaproteobacteria bacterium]|nr:porin family protein [Gammaproteobacteria bacterium]
MHGHSRIVIWGLSLIFLLLITGLVYADSGLYVDGAIGRTQLDTPIAGVALEDSATAVRANVGLDFGNNIAFEAGYLNLGEFEISSPFGRADASLDGATVAAVFRLPLTGNLAAMARGGLFIWQSEFSNYSATLATEGEDLFYGVGLQADISDRFSLTGEWDRFEFDDDTADALFFGFRLKF